MNRVSPLVCPILVGRDDLLELADRRLGAVGVGDGHLLLLAGEAGIGKTRLLRAIERTAASAGFGIARGAVAPRDAEVPASLVLDLARTMTRTPPFEQVGRTILRRLQGDDAGSSGDPHRRRRLLVLDIVETLVAAADRPAMISLENIQWADDLSLEILAGLASRLPEARLMVVATYRSDELYPRVPLREWRTRLLTQRLAEEARLTPLSMDDVATMTTLLLDAGLPAPSDVVMAIHARTDGIPLHVEELLAVFRDRPHPDGGAVDAAGVPDTIEGTVLARFRLRSARARALARAGAVIGRCFDVDIAAGMIGEPVDRMSAPLQELVDHFFLVPAGSSGLYDFRHALLREAIYGQIAGHDRRRMHGRVAELGGGLEGTTDAFASAHFEQAGMPQSAFRTALLGAEAAVRVSSHREALQLYQRVLRNAPRDLPPGDHARILESFASEAAANDENVVASEALGRARELYLTAGLIREAAAVLGPLTAIRHLLGDGPDVRSGLLRAGLDALDGLPADDETDRVRARLLAAQATVLCLDFRLDESEPIAHEARRIAQRVGDEPTEVNAVATLGLDAVFGGRTEQGWALLQEATDRARASRLEAEAARGYRWMGSAAWELVEYQLGERWLREGIAYAEGVERWNDRHYMAAQLANVLWATGRWDEASLVAEHALADGRGGLTTRISALFALGFLAMGRGDTSRARTCLDEALALGSAMGELLRLSPPLWGLAETALLAADPALAVRFCERGLAASESSQDSALAYPFLVTGTRAHLALGDPGAAERWVETMDKTLSLRAFPGTRAAIDHGRGLILMAGGSTGRAREAFESAVRSWDARQRIWEGSWARLDLAACLLRSNRPAAAIALLDEVRSIADRLGSRPLMGRVNDLAAAARTRRPAGELWSPLSAREFEVARLISAGQTNREIAGALRIADKTVSAHVEHILAKLGASRRSEVAAWVGAMSRLGDRRASAPASAVVGGEQDRGRPA